MSILINKYRKTTLICLTVIIQFIALLFFDSYVLPKTNIDDTISHYQNIKAGKDKSSFLGTRFFTEKGNVFSLEKNNLKSKDVILEKSLLFKSITSVKSENKDYKDLLISDLSGITLVLIIGLAVSSSVGVLILEKQPNLSENRFLNIVSLNFLLLCFTIYMFFAQS